MSSVAYNLKRKMEWMGRRIRHIDDAGEIKDWVEAMAAINRAVKELDDKVYSDDWRPWRTEGKKLKNTFMSEVDEGCLKNDLFERVPNDEAQRTHRINRVPPVRIETDLEDSQAKKKEDTRNAL